MTCIAGWIEENGKVWVAGDSAETAGTSLFLRTTPKAFSRTEDGIEWIFAISGIARGSQLLKYELCLPSSEGFNPDDVCEFVVTKLAPKIRDLFFEKGFLKKTNGVEEMDCPIMVGVRGHLFIIDPLFFVRENPENYATIGNGGTIAQGVLWASKRMEGMKTLSPKERLLLALKAAEETTTSVKSPFHVISTPP
jgi:hypothetical protein